MLNDTIAAIATPLGEGGLAVIRVSGPQALTVADSCFKPLGKNSAFPSQCASHTIHYGKVEKDGLIVDEVLLSVLRAPRTFTREDVVEISCHGGLLPAKLVLDVVLASGARLATPGEFTRRAFLNGRIDLAQAEAVIDIIHSRTELALAAANEQLAGRLSQRIHQLRDSLIKVLAHVEAHIDFPDEDIAPDTRGNLCDKMADGLKFMDDLLRTATEGQVLRRGIRAAIIGRPNVGKSSLLNLLLGHDRAIVSEIAGTTRDTITETANIRGLPVVFVDTAGLRKSDDVIEAEGVRRSFDSAEKSDLLIHVLDGSMPLDAFDQDLLEKYATRKRIIVRNKIDLPCGLDLPDGVTSPVVELSCMSAQGVNQLKDAIKEMVWSGEIKAEMLQVMINSRHQSALKKARHALEKALNALRKGDHLELAAMDLHIAVNTVGEIVGKTTTEDLLDSIFSQFCIGK